MAQIVNNEKQFKVIEMSSLEVGSVFGGMGFCDWCGEDHTNGFYIAVLNHWYCKKDYEMFLDRANNYDEDRNIEELNFLRATNLLKDNLIKK